MFGLPKETTTVSPRCLCKSESVVAPKTIWLLSSTAWPDRIGGATAAWLSPNRTGTVRPSIWTERLWYPAQAATSGSWLRAARACGGTTFSELSA